MAFHVEKSNVASVNFHAKDFSRSPSVFRTGLPSINQESFGSCSTFVMKHVTDGIPSFQ